MAKKISDTDNPAADQVTRPDEPIEVETTVQGELPKTTQIKKPKAETGTTEIPLYIDKILRAYPDYVELYIDSAGGTFTADTPPTFRSNATLYRNPYHKP